jgi:hypothetical protein
MSATNNTKAAAIPSEEILSRKVKPASDEQRKNSIH